MKRVLFFGYRDWACQISHYLYEESNNFWEYVGTFTIAQQKVSCWPGTSCEVIDPKYMNSRSVIEKIKSYKPDYMIFAGWSWIVGKEILEICPCICLHPSPLPKYRGGSPIQHQIINGEEKSAVSLFFMTDGIDDGDILSQTEISLSGNISDIYREIAFVGMKDLERVLDGLCDGSIVPVKQDEFEATTFNRRKKKDSELTFEQFRDWDCEKLYNFIRCLTDPYPNAFIKDKKGDILLFKSVELVRAKNEK